MPKPPRLTRAEVGRRARRIADAWRAEMETPLDSHQLAVLVRALAREAVKEHESDLLTWADGGMGGFGCCYFVLKRRMHDLPDQVVLSLAAWALLDVAGAIRR